MEQVSRRSSNSSAQRRLSPQMSLVVPGVMAASLSPAPTRLAPPSESEAQAQRRFSEHEAAVARHNSRRAAKRSKSVMYRAGGGPRRGPARRNSTDIQAPDMHTQQQQQHLLLDPYAAAAAAQQQQQQQQQYVAQQQQLAQMQQQQQHMQVPLHATLSAPSPSRRSSSLRHRSNR